MTEDLNFISKHRGNGALLDANLLLVFLVGAYDLNMMQHFHHTKQYVEDFPLIKWLVGQFPIIHTTPNVLTEVSNLAKDLGEKFFDTFQHYIEPLQETYCISKDAAIDPHFRKIGLTDTALLGLAAKGVLILTADWALAGILRSRNIDAVNFNHLRQAYWGGYLGEF